jgi:hypothetical protein
MECEVNVLLIIIGATRIVTKTIPNVFTIHSWEKLERRTAEDCPSGGSTHLKEDTNLTL